MLLLLLLFHYFFLTSRKGGHSLRWAWPSTGVHLNLFLNCVEAQSKDGHQTLLPVQDKLKTKYRKLRLSTWLGDFLLCPPGGFWHQTQPGPAQSGSVAGQVISVKPSRALQFLFVELELFSLAHFLFATLASTAGAAPRPTSRGLFFFCKSKFAGSFTSSCSSHSRPTTS